MTVGYASSGRMRADNERDFALAQRRLAHSCFRSGMPFQGRVHMHRALRAWKTFRFFKSRISK